MGTKNNPGAYDCYANALPDEPMFVLLARDPDAPDQVEAWAWGRYDAIRMGERPASDMAMVEEARECAKAMRAWRAANDGAWRNKKSDVDRSMIDRALAVRLREMAADFAEPDTNDGADYRPDPRVNDLLTAADALDRFFSERQSAAVDMRARAAKAATDRYDVAPENDSEPAAYHAGWERCARQIATAIRALPLEIDR